MAQSFNPDAIMYIPVVMLRPGLLRPHFSVKDISKIDPEKLKELGFKGLVFDKDNTLTAPYENEIYPSIKDAFARYRQVFGSSIVIMSNSAGTGDDPNQEDARSIEQDLGIEVMIHVKKKPAGIESVVSHFRCEPKFLAMFGDRLLTDVVFGNRYGMLTVHTAMLTEKGDNKAAAKIRRYELPLLKRLRRKGYQAPQHSMYDPSICLEELTY
jgi:phosphatidylglycerophosphatase GEP4